MVLKYKFTVHGCALWSLASIVLASVLDSAVSGCSGSDWIEQCFTSPPTQYTVGYMGDGFYRSKDPTNSIKILKEKAVKENNTKKTKKTEITHMHAHTK